MECNSCRNSRDNADSVRNAKFFLEPDEELLAMNSTPVISVVVPLPDDRGHLRDCLRGFSQQMLEVPYELIVSTVEASPENLADLIEEFPQVRWLHQPGSRVNALYNLGAKEAQGEHLYISESHCVPQPDCLQKAYEMIRDANLELVNSASNGINGNCIAAGEQRIFEEDFDSLCSQAKLKVSIRGTMIKRSIWEKAGGFLAEFGHFSEIMLSRKLAKMGVKFGVAKDSFVSHANQTTLRGLAEELVEYGHDEMASYEFAPPEETTLISWHWYRRSKYLRKWGCLNVLRIRLSIQQTQRKLAIWFLPMSAERRFELYRRYWGSSIELGHLRYLAKLVSRNAPQYAPEPPPAKVHQTAS